MMRISARVCLALLVACFTFPLYAEPAPVYDADAPPQTADANDGQEMPPSDQDNTFVPMEAERSPASEVANSVPVENLSVPQRIRKLEQQIANMQNSGANVRIEALQNQIQMLTGQVEQLNHRLQQYQAQKAQPVEVDKRNAETAIASKTPVTDEQNAKSAAKIALAVKPPVKSDQPNVAEEQQIYQTAYNLIRSKKYAEAVTVLQNMLQKYPSGQFAANAHYWLGELYGLLGKTDQALNEFQSVVKTYPDSLRVSDAQLKIGLIYAAQFKWIDAKSALRRVINRYPGTTSARLANEQLKQIRQAGN